MKLPLVSPVLLNQWRADAENGKDALFSNWTFFDTNCLSELVKLSWAGSGDRVRQFVNGRDVIIPGTVLQELRHVPKIAEEIPTVLSTANLYWVAHPTNFWFCDLWNFFNIDRYPRNALGTVPFPPDLFKELQSERFADACRRAEERARTEFLAQVQRDMGEQIDERKLGALIWGKVSEQSEKEFKVEIPVADCRPNNFPAFFAYYYAYYFSYLNSNNAVPEINDFIDLANVCIAPYCTEFYTERKLALVLRSRVQGLLPPTPFATAKRLHKMQILGKRSYEEARGSGDMKIPTSELLPRTAIYNFRELNEKVLAA